MEDEEFIRRFAKALMSGGLVSTHVLCEAFVRATSLDMTCDDLAVHIIESVRAAEDYEEGLSSIHRLLKELTNPKES